MRKMEFQGIPITIENEKGSYRHWKDPLKGESGRTYMSHSYGYIRRTEGADGEGVDVYVGPNEDSPTAFVVRQVCPITGEYDEDKVMLGFYTYDEAKAAYLGQYDDSGFFGSMDSCRVDNLDDCILPQPKQKYLEVFGDHGASVIKAKKEESKKKKSDNTVAAPKRAFINPELGAGLSEGIGASYARIRSEASLGKVSSGLAKAVEGLKK